jgi:Serine dehydrogenase proteinase
MLSSKIINLIEKFKKYQSGVFLGYIDSDLEPKSFSLSDADKFYQTLKKLKINCDEPINCLIHLNGGSINAARKLGLLLRSFSRKIRFFVPERAKSAGTLLCLSGNEIFADRFAEFSPIDPQIQSQGYQPNMPMAISPLQIRGFKNVASDWFKVNRPEDLTQVFGYLTQNFFPSTIGSFWLAEKHTLSIAIEFLKYNLADKTFEERESVCEKLVNGFFDHNQSLYLQDLVDVGLNIAEINADENTILRKIIDLSAEKLLDNSPEKIVKRNAFLFVEDDLFVHEFKEDFIKGSDGSTFVENKSLGWASANIE